MKNTAEIEGRQRGWVLYRRGLSLGLTGLGWIFALVVMLQAWEGDVWAKIFYAESPLENLFASVFFFIAGHVVRRGPEMSGRDAGIWVGKLMLLGVSFALSFLIAEVGIRRILEGQLADNTMDRLKELRAQGRMPPVTSATPLAHIIEPTENPRIVFTLLPHLDMLFGGKRLVTNELGMRDEESYDVDRPPEPSFRILGLGDSGMFGWGVEQDEMYLARLRDALRARGDGVTYEVMNTGVPGYNTAQEVEVFATKWRAYQPDLVVVGWCYNDYFLPHFLLERVDFRRRDLSFLYELLFQRDNFRKLIYGVQFQDRSEVDIRFLAEELREGSEVEGVRRALSDLKRMAEEDGFDLVVWGVMDPTITSICQDLDLPYFDVEDQIPEQPEYKEWGVYWMHPRAEGHRVLAEAKETWLGDLGLLP